MKGNIQSDAWIEQLCKGDELAYKVLFDVYYQILAHFAMKFLHDKEACEDIVHDAILDLYSSKRVFTNINSLKSFLYLSIKNRSINYLQHKKAEEKYLHDVSVIHGEEFFLDAIIEEEVYFLMHKAINELPEQIQNKYELSLKGKPTRKLLKFSTYHSIP